jgi:uncharacterized protein
MTNILTVTLAGAGLMFGLGTAGAASFDCAKAKSKIEQAICADPSLSDLDEYLGRYYGGAAQTLNDGASCLKAEQRVWVKTVRDACGTNTACLKDVYLKRLGALDGLQPGVTKLKNVELPGVPMMITAIPAAADTVAGKPGKPIRISGKIIHEMNDLDTMGYAVKPEGGKAAAFIFDMDLGSSPTHEAVRALAAQPGGARYEVRGFATRDGGFDDAQCRYVYLLP